MNLLFLFHLAGLNTVYALISPVYKWPLNHINGVNETQQQLGGDHSPNNLVTYAAGPNGNDNFSIVFNGSEFIQTDLQETVDFVKFSLCMFIYPESLTGTMFHYQSTSLEDNGIHTINISATGSGSWSLHLSSVQGSRSIDRSSGVTLNVWHFFCLIRDNANDKMQIIYQDSVVFDSSDMIPASIKDFLPGAIRLGVTSENTDFFTGRIACVTFHNTVVLPSDKVTIMTKCEIPPAVPTFIRLWPLDNAVFGYELKTTQQPTLPDNSACMRIGVDGPSVPNKSIYLDGGLSSFLQTTLPLNLLQNYVSIAFFVRPFYPLTGTLLHFLYSGTNTGIKMLKIRVFEGNLEVSLEDSEGNGLCGKVNIDSAFSVKDWYYVGFYKQDDIGLIVVKNLRSGTSSNYKLPNTCVSAAADLRETGILRIGDAVEGGDNFRGLFRCLAVNDGLELHSEELLIQQCSAPNISLVPPFDYASCTAVPPMRNQYIKKIQENAKPLRLESIMMSLTLQSIRQCAWKCLTRLRCRSVTVRKLAAAQYMCTLYDFATKGIGLVRQLGTDYYVIA